MKTPWARLGIHSLSLSGQLILPDQSTILVAYSSRYLWYTLFCGGSQPGNSWKHHPDKQSGLTLRNIGTPGPETSPVIFQIVSWAEQLPIPMLKIAPHSLWCFWTLQNFTRVFAVYGYPKAVMVTLWFGNLTISIVQSLLPAGIAGKFLWLLRLKDPLWSDQCLFHPTSPLPPGHSTWRIFVPLFLVASDFEPSSSPVLGKVSGWWFQPLWKIWKSVGMMTFPIYGKIKNVPNHQPGFCSCSCIVVPPTIFTAIYFGIFVHSAYSLG